MNLKQHVAVASILCASLVIGGCETSQTEGPTSETSNQPPQPSASELLAQDSWTSCDVDRDHPPATGPDPLPVILYSSYQTVQVNPTTAPANTVAVPSTPQPVMRRAPSNSEPDMVPADDDRPPYPVIINGDPVNNVSDFPWIAHLKIVMTDGVNEWTSYCGGSLVDDQWIMTAAHCVDVAEAEAGLQRQFGGTHNLDLIRVEVGLGDVNRANMDRIVAQTALCHADYDAPARLNNDIALLKLDVAADTSGPDIRTANLPLQGSDPLQSGSGTISTVPIGWGLTETNQSSAQLLKVTLMADTASADPYEFTARGPLNVNQSICQGDSGGPTHIDVTAATPQNATILGLSSYVRVPVGAYGCDYQNVPSTFTRVSSYREAIDAAIAHCGDGSCQ